MLDKFGQDSEDKDLMGLARDFFSMSNDGFFRKHGFNWVPPEPYYSLAKKERDDEWKMTMKAHMRLAPILNFNGKLY